MNPIQTADSVASTDRANPRPHNHQFTHNSHQRTVPTWREQYQNLMRSCGYCPRTESAYLHWIQEFHHFQTQQPSPPSQSTLDTCHAESFLNHLREARILSNSALNQAFNALRLYYDRLLQRPFPDKAEYPPVRRVPPSPTTLSPEVVRRIFTTLNPSYQVHARLIYGSGLRLAELLRIQIQDLQLSQNHLVVRDYKCEPCRTTFIPCSLKLDIANQIDEARRLWEADQISYNAAVRVARISSGTRPAPPVDWPRSWLFPSTNPRLTASSANWPRHHQPEDNIQRALRRAASLARVNHPVSPEILRHSFAAHLLEKGSDLGTVQELLGHNRSFRDSIYRHFVKRVSIDAVSPLDML